MPLTFFNWYSVTIIKMRTLILVILTLFSYSLFSQGVSNPGMTSGSHSSSSQQGSISGTIGQAVSGTEESEEGDECTFVVDDDIKNVRSSLIASSLEELSKLTINTSLLRLHKFSRSQNDDSGACTGR